jgi:hypothetical protein
MSIPQERKSHIINTQNMGGAFLRHEKNSSTTGSSCNLTFLTLQTTSTRPWLPQSLLPSGALSALQTCQQEGQQEAEPVFTALSRQTSTPGVRTTISSQKTWQTITNSTMTMMSSLRSGLISNLTTMTNCPYFELAMHLIPAETKEEELSRSQ